MIRNMMTGSWAMAAAILLAGGASQASVVTLQQGVNDYTGQSAGPLMENYATLAHGNATALEVGSWGGRAGQTRLRTLIRFDLSSLADQNITGASLKLTLVSTVAGTVDSPTPWSATFNLYRISDANAAWVAGNTNANYPGSAGLATWGYLSVPSGEGTDPAQGTGGVAWAGSAGLTTAGVDYVATPVASVTVSSSDSAGTVYTLTFTDVSFLNDWAANPAANAGFVLVADSLEASSRQAATFASGNNATVSSRPVLEITSSPIPEPAALGMLGMGGLAVMLRRR